MTPSPQTQELYQYIEIMFEDAYDELERMMELTGNVQADAGLVGDIVWDDLEYYVNSLLNDYRLTWLRRLADEFLQKVDILWLAEKYINSLDQPATRKYIIT